MDWMPLSLLVLYFNWFNEAVRTTDWKTLVNFFLVCQCCCHRTKHCAIEIFQLNYSQKSCHINGISFINHTHTHTFIQCARECVMYSISVAHCYYLSSHIASITSQYLTDCKQFRHTQCSRLYSICKLIIHRFDHGSRSYQEIMKKKQERNGTVFWNW